MTERGRHIDALVSGLSGVVREDAWHSLADLGPGVAPDVIAILQNIDEPTMATELIRLLAEYRSPEAIPVLVGRLRDPARDVWQAALDALVTIGTVQGEEALTAAAATTMPEDRKAWISEALEQIRGVERESLPSSELWAAVANVKLICPKGPGGAEERNGIKHFRGGAKVYVIDAFWGMCNDVTVIGQHRKSRRFMCLHMPAKHIENLRPRLVYSPAVLSLMREHYASAGRSEPPGKEHAERICDAVPQWSSVSPDPIPHASSVAGQALSFGSPARKQRTQPVAAFFRFIKRFLGGVAH
jgi:hypothetical protein